MIRFDARPVECQLELLAIPARVLGQLRGRCRCVRSCAVAARVHLALARQPNAAQADLARIDAERPDLCLDRDLCHSPSVLSGPAEAPSRGSEPRVQGQADSAKPSGVVSTTPASFG